MVGFNLLFLPARAVLRLVARNHRVSAVPPSSRAGAQADSSATDRRARPGPRRPSRPQIGRGYLRFRLVVLTLPVTVVREALRLSWAVTKRHAEAKRSRSWSTRICDSLTSTTG